MERHLVYFVSDIHLGLGTADPAEREERFVSFLRTVRENREAKALFLLGDIWDFWYEYRDVIPREGFRVTSELSQMVQDGVEVSFFPGNHDIWCYSFFESIGIRKLDQPFRCCIGGKEFCIGHGDLLGGAKKSYRLMLDIFRCRPLQVLFSTLHPWIAYRIGLGWSNSNRRTHAPYKFRNEEEPLYRFASEKSRSEAIDIFVFGHFHDLVDLTLPSGSRFVVLKDWMTPGTMPHAVFDITSSSFELRWTIRQ